MLVNMREMLQKARKNGYAVGMFDVSDLEMIRAVVGEAEVLNSPVILGALWPDLENGRLPYWAVLARKAAEEAKVPVCLHLDHALKLEQVKAAVEAGFTSVMLDASAAPFEENIRLSAEVVRCVGGRDITVEAELGHVGNGWVGSGEGTAGPDALTEPGSVREFLERTHVDALAVSIGTAHGVYIKAPKLDIPLLREIAAAAGEVPLVLHGGSGTPADQLREAIANGITKVNIYSELLTAWNTALAEELKKQPHMAVWPAVLRKNPDAAMREVIRQKIRFFGSAGKA